MKALMLFLLLAAGGAGQTDQTVARVAETEAHLPWFWSPPMEGFFEIRYTFESEGLHRVLDARGHDKKSALRLHLERTAVLGGIFNRCVSENGTSPCSAAMLATYQRGNEKVVFGQEEKSAVRERRLQFWGDFPQAFRFEALTGDRFRFVPRRDYNPGAGSQQQLLAGIQGEFTVDPRTYEVTALSYEVLKNVEIPGRSLTKGSRYAVTLTNSVNGHYLPSHLLFEQPLGKDRVVQAEDYSNYKRFTTDTTLRFGDVPDPR
jgi:hypothetical protein